MCYLPAYHGDDFDIILREAMEMHNSAELTGAESEIIYRLKRAVRKLTAKK